MNMNKIALLIIAVGGIVALGIILFQPQEAGRDADISPKKDNVEIRDGVQLITIVARGGYTPRATEAQAGIPTKLIVKTNGTYDCSAALVIRSIGYQKILPPTGEEIIDLGTTTPGTLRGLCSMGMYGFTIDFISPEVETNGGG